MTTPRRSTWWNSQISAESGTITLDMLKEAWKKMEERQYTLHVHLISGPAYELGEGRCIECGAWVVCHDR